MSRFVGNGGVQNLRMAWDYLLVAVCLMFKGRTPMCLVRTSNTHDRYSIVSVEVDYDREETSATHILESEHIDRGTGLLEFGIRQSRRYIRIWH